MYNRRMRIDAFLNESPMFAINRAARRFDSVAARALASDGLGFLEGLVLAAIFFDAPESARPSQLAETFGTTRGKCEPLHLFPGSQGISAEKDRSRRCPVLLSRLEAAGKAVCAARHPRL